MSREWVEIILESGEFFDAYLWNASAIFNYDPEKCTSQFPRHSKLRASIIPIRPIYVT